MSPIRTTTLRGTALALAASALIAAAAGAAPASAADWSVRTPVDRIPAPAGSLRWAINQANSNAGADTIRFDLPPTANPQVITLARNLPAITDPATTVDGYTQLGSAPSPAPGTPAQPQIVIDAAGAPQGLSVATNDSLVQGLVIDGAATDGLLVNGNRNRVLGNFIGTDLTGGTGVGNPGNGIDIEGDDNEIGSPRPADQNVVAGNGTDVRITIGADNHLRNNLLGTDALGATSLGSGAGVVVESVGNFVGGTGEREGNTISGHSGSGVEILANDNTVQGNLIGTDSTGSSPLGNDGDGIAFSGARRALVSANVVAHSGGAGVDVRAGSGRVTIERNSIFDNTGIGIDLGDDGATANDPASALDADPGPNDLQNKPVVTSATVGGKFAPPNTTTIQWALDSVANTRFRVELYRTPGCDQGRTFLGTQDVTTDAVGHASATLLVGRELTGEITATATRLGARGETSEFGDCRAVHVLKGPLGGH